ncbi:MAG: Rpn family recombination-promoting nuclease/putative transposase [Desulfococcaceae bacterium]
MNENHHPHDRFFKELFSRPEVSRDFLINYLPGEITEILDLSSLELTKDTFIDKELREHFSDMLCKMKLKSGGAVYVYALLEHKSRPERLTSFQVLRYMVKIWERDIRIYRQKRKQMKKKGVTLPVFHLSPIIPAVIYHGAEKWNISPDFRELFQTHPAMDGFIPDFSHLLFDISHYDDDEIKGMVMLRVGLLMMKYIFRDDLAENLPGILSLLRDLAGKRTGLEYLETVAIYLVKATGRLTETELVSAMEKSLPSGGELMETIAERWMKRGEIRGEIKGEIRGKISGLLTGIETGLELKFGQEGLGILPEIRTINDVGMLISIQKGLLKVKSLHELRKIYN